MNYQEVNGVNGFFTGIACIDIFLHLIYSTKMPELSRFYGIVVYMFAKDHVPPHFHAKYGEYLGILDIETGELKEGKLPRRALRLVQDWAELHKTELYKNWEEAQKNTPNFSKIEPLQ